MAEREQQQEQPFFNAEAIARTLAVELLHDEFGEPEMLVEDPASRVSVRVTLHDSGRAASFYMRVGLRFGGFLHIVGIEKVELRAKQREVHFWAPLGDRQCHFAVANQGVLLALANIEEDDSIVSRPDG